MKKIILVLFSICLLSSSIPTSAYASANAQFSEAVIVYLDKYADIVNIVARIDPKESARNIKRKTDKIIADLSPLGDKQKRFISNNNPTIAKLARELYALNTDTINKLNDFKSAILSSSADPSQLRQTLLQNIMYNFQKITTITGKLSKIMLDMKSSYMKTSHMQNIAKDLTSPNPPLPYTITEGERSSLLKLIDNIIAKNEKEGSSSPVGKFFIVSTLNKIRIILGGIQTGNPSLMSLSR